MTENNKDKASSEDRTHHSVATINQLVIHYRNIEGSFQDFMWLSEILKKRHGNNVIPPLYTKEKLANKIDFYYIVKQQKYLCDFTEACFKQENLLLDPVFALFFQSDLTINELEDFTCGKFDDDFLREIWVKNGITKVPEIDYWDKVTSDEYYEEVICKQNTEQPI